MRWFKSVLCLMLILALGFTLSTNETQAASKKVSLKISNGGNYYGEVKNGKPHGKGTAQWGKNKTYSGDWVNGKRSGIGKYIVKDYSESYMDSIMGELDNVRTTTYIGKWSNDKMNGEGFYRDNVRAFHDGNQFDEINEGTFKNNNFVSGYTVGMYSNKDIVFSYNSSVSEIIVQTDKFNFQSGTFSKMIENKEYQYLTVTTRDAKGNEKMIGHEYNMDVLPQVNEYKTNKRKNGNIVEEKAIKEYEVGAKKIAEEVDKILNKHKVKFDKLLPQLFVN
ncbi:hypothetical protein PAECIP112173_01561 [Paenibacillus sp. JJ-100]|uniref:hypothetical protein n=1 Tax=Paenibacillus sp. JJ-100 TaxID=2974896 RepID=UPI0022FF8815|nr:hypothetical protein [Paenibacillus sp. JJ-100]CAI6055377.1 hypothetical protein PAECIP112173_01561 [Paenibacillus sp. JJ-100]